MNRPGEPEGNWAWRLEPGQPDAHAAERLRALAKRYRRV
jgi:4-alpha-glucanotransferase